MSRLDWDLEGHAWPQSAQTRFVPTRGLTWRVVDAGTGPSVLLIHGTGASAHSWRGVIPLLATGFRVIAPDLPGHGFTRGRPPAGLSLAGIVEAVDELLVTLSCEPALLVGHSAGAAIVLEYARRRDPGVPVIGFSPALLPFPGLAARLFPALAKLLFVNPFAPSIFARMARVPGETQRFLVRSTGSRIDDEGLRCYAALLGNAGHCEGALGMMASWDLAGFAASLPGIGNPVLLIHGSGDPAIPLEAVQRAAALLPSCRLEVAEHLGHLAHEEGPEMAARHVGLFAASHRIVAKEPAA